MAPSGALCWPCSTTAVAGATARKTAPELGGFAPLLLLPAAVKKLENPYPGLAVGLGLVIGIAIGAAMDNVGVGVALGLVFGAAIGVARSRQGNADLPDE